jgi:glutamyl-Q tRNA(Asp) synthetase
MAEAGHLAWLEGLPDAPADRIPADPAAWGDAVLKRKEFAASYHIAVVVDDAAQGVTHVVRGRDLYHATSLHRLLQHLLGLAAPRYHHHRLIAGDDGAKLAKSRGSPGLADLRAAGVSADEVRRMAAT